MAMHRALALVLTAVMVAGCQASAENAALGVSPTQSLRWSRPAVSTADFTWVKGAKATLNVASVAMCPSQFPSLIGGGSSYGPDGKTSGPGTPVSGFGGWQSGTDYTKTVVSRGHVTYHGAAWAWASCADAAAATYFQWVSSVKRSHHGEVGAKCPTGWVLIGGFATGEGAQHPQWQYWVGTANNAYWAQAPTAWASCGSYSLVNVTTYWGKPPSVLQGCPAGTVVVGGGSGFVGLHGTPRYPGPPTQQYPVQQNGQYTAWRIGGKTRKLLNISACVPRYP